MGDVLPEYAGDRAGAGAENPAYEDVASKFFEHFVYIAHAMNDMGGEGIELWDEEDGFYYDVLHLPNGERHYLKVRSMVGLIPLFAVETLEPDIVDGCRDSSGACSGSSTIIRMSEITSKWRRYRAGGAAIAVAGESRATRRVLVPCWTNRNFCRRMAFGRFHKFSQRQSLRDERQRQRSSRGLMNLRNRAQVCSAAIPIGADPSGSLSISC